MLNGYPVSQPIEHPRYNHWYVPCVVAVLRTLLTPILLWFSRVVGTHGRADGQGVDTPATLPSPKRLPNKDS